MSKEEVEILINKLESLELKQEQLTSEIAEARREIKDLRRTSRKDQVEAITGSDLYYGDTVVILNPSTNQETRGKVCGVTKDGLVKVQPRKGKPIRRLPKNLKKVL